MAVYWVRSSLSVSWTSGLRPDRLVSVSGELDMADFESRPAVPSADTIRQLLAERVDDYRLSPGLVVGTADQGERQLVSYGQANTEAGWGAEPDTVFEIGSVTKLFTVLLLADMAHRREMSLGDPVALYLPADVHVPDWDGQSITVSDLARHTSSLPRIPTNLARSDPTDPTAD